MKLEELARLAGVSKATANIILGGKADRYKISAATRNRVMNLVDKYQYIPDARAVPEINSKQLALIIPSLAHRGFALLTHELEKMGRKKGYLWQLYCTQDDPEIEKSILRSLSGQKIEAMASISTLWDDSLYRKMQQQGIRTIFLDRRLSGSALGNVTNDDVQAAYELTQLLLKNQEVPDPIVYFGGINSMDCSEKRLEGFNKALNESGYTGNDVQIYHKDYSVAAGYALAEEYVQTQGKLPGNLFAASFTLMDGVLGYIRKYPQHRPERPNWATFGDSDMLDLMPFSIHSSRQEYKEFAEKFFNLLEERKEKSVVIRRTLVERNIEKDQ